MRLNIRSSARLLGLAAALAAGVVIAADDGDTLANLMALLSQRRQGLADFTQTQYLSVLKRPQRSTGVLSYEAPDHLEQRTLKPHPQTAMLDHGVLTLTRGSRQRSVRLDEYPQLAPLIESVRATLAGDLPALDRRFQTRLTGDLGHWQLELTPRESGLALGVERIQLSGERDRILQVEVRQSGGDRTLMTIKPRE